MEGKWVHVGKLLLLKIKNYWWEIGVFCAEFWGEMSTLNFRYFCHIHLYKKATPHKQIEWIRKKYQSPQQNCVSLCVALRLYTRTIVEIHFIHSIIFLFFKYFFLHTRFTYFCLLTSLHLLFYSLKYHGSFSFTATLSFSLSLSFTLFPSFSITHMQTFSQKLNVIQWLGFFQPNKNIRCLFQ